MAKTNKTSDPDTNLKSSVGAQVPEASTVQPPVQPQEPSLVGQIISLNQKLETYFGVGEIWLTPENYWATIPEDLSPQDIYTIKLSLQRGSIVLGKQFIAPVDKASNTLEQYWLAVERSGFEQKKTKDMFAQLLRRGTDSGWTALEICNFCIEKEQKGKGRKDVLRLLNQVLKHYDGPIRLYDPPDTEEGIKKVTIKSDGSMIATTNSGKEIAKSVVAPAVPPKEHVKGTKSATEVVNDIFS